MNPKFTVTNAITKALARIERMRGFLDATKLSQDWIEKTQEKALVLEAHYTTHIEGTELSLEEAKILFKGGSIFNVDPDDRQELLNYRIAFDLVSDYLLKKRPITQGLIREIHRRLVGGVRGGAADPGEYRKIQNLVVNSNTKKVIYTPPPAYEVTRLMTELVDWIQKEREINPILVAGIAQFQLVHIHPFLDGNGRVARLLSTLYLYHRGYDFKKLFSISEFYDRDRIKYYQAIQSVRNNDMDLTFWLEYFSYGLSSQLKEVQGAVEKVIKLDVITAQKKLSEFQKIILNLTLEMGGISLQDVIKKCPEVSKRTLQREIKHLLEINLLLATGETVNRLYRIHPECISD